MNMHFSILVDQKSKELGIYSGQEIWKLCVCIHWKSVLLVKKMSMTINDRIEIPVWKEKISVNAMMLYLNAVKPNNINIWNF